MNIFGNRKVQLQIVSQYSLPAYRSGLNGANVGLGALPGSFWHHLPKPQTLSGRRGARRLCQLCGGHGSNQYLLKPA